MLGHTSVAITLDRYSRVITTMQAEAVRQLDGVLSGRLRVRLIPQPREEARFTLGSGAGSGDWYRIPDSQ